MTRLLPLARVLTASAARAAGPIAIPLYLGLLLALPVLFGGNGMRAADVTRVALASPAVALGLLAAWLLLTAPVARAVVDLPATFALRALPVPREHFVVVTGVHLAAIHLPWVVLWARGEGPAAGLSAAATAAGAHGLILARSARPAEIAAGVALLAAAARPGLVTLPLAIGGAALGVAAAWRRAPERASRGRRGALPAWPPAALAASLLRAARRAEPGVILRGALLAALGGLAAPLVARGHDLDVTRDAGAARALSLEIAAFSLGIAGSGVAAAALRAEQAQAWILDAAGVGGELRAAALALATAAAGAALGLAHGALAALGLGTGPWSAARLVAGGAAWGAALGALAAWHARRSAVASTRRDRWGPVRLLGLILVAIAAAGALAELSIPVIAAVAVGLTAVSARTAAALPPPRCAHRAGRVRP